MPCDYKKYPKDWKAIRAKILDREGHCCKGCGIDNYSVVYWDNLKNQYERACGSSHINQVGCGDLGYVESRLMADLWNEQAGGKYWIVIVLTIAHLNHNITDNSPDNLAALCQRCHLNHDKVLHKTNAKATREKKLGIIKLF